VDLIDQPDDEHAGLGMKDDAGRCRQDGWIPRILTVDCCCKITVWGSPGCGFGVPRP
jgi:hypothetical protein